jgi:hypothetical protein
MNVFQKLHIKANGESDIAGLYFSTNYLGGSGFAKSAICVIGRGSGSFARGDMYFCLNNSGSTSDINLTRDTKMRITWEGTVGIGKTNPSTLLDVNGTITGTLFSGPGSSLSALNASNITSGILTVSQGGTGSTTLTSGSILVGNGTSSLIQPTNLVWDNTNTRFGIVKTNTITTILTEIKMLLPDFVLPSILSNSGKFSMFLIVKNS